MKPNCSNAWLVVLGLVLLLAGCGGGGASEPIVAPPFSITAAASSSAKAVQTLTSAGGSISLTTENGTQFELMVPAGALPADTSITLQSQDKIGGQYFNLRLLPSGLLLSNGLQATLTISLPSGASLPASGTLAYDGAPTPFTRLPDGRLQLLLSGFAKSLALSPVASAKLQKPLGIGESLQSTTTTSTATCAGISQLGNMGAGELTAAEINDPAIQGQCMISAIEQLVATGEYAEAARAAGAIATYLQLVGAGNAGQYVTLAESITCTAYSRVLDYASTSLVNNMDNLYKLVQPVLYWEMTAQQLGANCAVSPYNIGLLQYQDVIHNKITEALSFYQAQKPQIANTTTPQYAAAVKEAEANQRTSQETRALISQAPSPQALATVKNVLITEVEQRAQPALLDSMLQAPWQRCRDSGNFDELIRLMDLLHQPLALKDAAQYCATRLQAVSRLSNGDVAETLSPALGGERAGTNNTRGSLYVPRNGRLELSGAIAALGCPSGRTGGSEGLSVRIAGVEVRRLEAPYLGSPAFIEMASALQTAGVDDAAFEAPLTIERVGAPCSGFWGDSPAPLLQLDLNFSDDMRVTVFKTRDACNVLVDPTLPVTDAKFFRSDTTDESIRMSLPVDKRANCGPRDWTATQQLRRVDARTLRWQQEARWSFNWYDLGPFAKFAEGVIAQWMYYNVQFARAGRVTVTFEQTAGSCVYREGSGGGFYAYTIARSGIEKGVSGCVTEGAPEPTPSLSFDVVAGQTQSFLSYVQVSAGAESDTLAREHASTHTIRFEPAP